MDYLKIPRLLGILAALIIVTILSVCGTQTAQAQTTSFPRIWLSSLRVPDYMTLFTNPSSWKTGLAHVQVLKLSTFLVTRAGNKGLESIIRFTQAHHIKLALEAGMLTPGPNGCGEGVEGYREPGFMLDLAQRIQKLGGQIDIIAMDEPYYFGHVSNSFWKPGSAVCRASITQVAQNVAQTIASVRTVFPNVEVGDIEPIMNYASVSAKNDTSIPQLANWASAFARATGRPLSFIHFDIIWKPQAFHGNSKDAENGWTTALMRAVHVAQSNHLPYGIIINGQSTSTSNLAWTASAEEHFKVIEQKLNFQPNDLVFQSWNKFPDQVGPETTSGTLTNLLADYVRWHNNQAIHSDAPP